MRTHFVITFLFLAVVAHAIEITRPPNATAQEKRFITTVERGCRRVQLARTDPTNATEHKSPIRMFGTALFLNVHQNNNRWSDA